MPKLLKYIEKNFFQIFQVTLLEVTVTSNDFYHLLVTSQEVTVTSQEVIVTSSSDDQMVEAKDLEK